jgi:hypothetical protein
LLRHLTITSISPLGQTQNAAISAIGFQQNADLWVSGAVTRFFRARAFFQVA